MVENGEWFHAINFGGNQISRGRFSTALPPNYTLYGTLRYLELIDPQGKDCLDIGTMDGLVAFSLKQRGAASVVATDVASRDEFEFGRKQLGLDIEYLPGLRICDFSSALQQRRFDLIVCAGVLYHLIDPMANLVTLRQAIKEGGLLVLETQYEYGKSDPVLSFIPLDKTNVSTNSFFRPSYRALIGMLELANFEIISTIAVNARLTVLAKAVRSPKTRDPMIETIRHAYHTHKHYDEVIGDQALVLSESVSTIQYEPLKHIDYFISAARFRTSNALQPIWRSSLGLKLMNLVMDGYVKARTCIARGKYLADISVI